jgi:hypothetical protein
MQQKPDMLIDLHRMHENTILGMPDSKNKRRFEATPI